MTIAEIVVPEWYQKARCSGVYKEELHDKVTAHCLTAMRRHAARKGMQEPEHVEPEVVKATVDMYEFALKLTGGDS